MTDYTPTTEQVRGQYTREDPPPIATMGEKRAEFDRWLEQVKAEAWEEGYDVSEGEWMHIYDGHPVPKGELCPECYTGNPYRKEQDR